jgi:flagellar hook-basal body complex protein FliE
MEIDYIKPISKDIMGFVKLLKFKSDKNKIVLLGTGSLGSQLYFSDYDMFCKVLTKQSPLNTYKYFMQILTKTNHDPNMYFIEFKVQAKNGDKQKFYKVQDINKGAFLKVFGNGKHVDYCKIDYVVKIGNVMIELSIIYSFDPDPLNKTNLIKSLHEDMAELRKKGNYYKALKRQFAIHKLQGKRADKLAMVKISQLFNSEVGHLYKHNSNVKALKLLLENYNDKYTLDQVKVNLKDLNLPADVNVIDKVIKAYDTIINREGKAFK